MNGRMMEQPPAMGLAPATPPPGQAAGAPSLLQSGLQEGWITPADLQKIQALQQQGLDEDTSVLLLIQSKLGNAAPVAAAPPTAAPQGMLGAPEPMPEPPPASAGIRRASPLAPPLAPNPPPPPSGASLRDALTAGRPRLDNPWVKG